MEKEKYTVDGLKRLVARDRDILEGLGNKILDIEEKDGFKVGDRVDFMWEDIVAMDAVRMRKIEAQVSGFYQDKKDQVLTLVYTIPPHEVYFGIPTEKLMRT